MIKLTAAQLQCDRCKAASELCLTGDTPPGWLTRAEIRRPDGLFWNELCPNCGGLPYAKLMEAVSDPAAPAV